MNSKFLFRIIFFILGMILFLDGFILICLNKIHLGTILPFLIGLIFCIYSVFHTKINLFLSQHSKLNKLWKIGWILFSIWAISLFSFFVYLNQHIKNQNNTLQPQAIIVLGSGVTQGKPSVTLAKRLDQAANVAQDYPQAWLILSGGLDFGETTTEAAVMSEYLTEKYSLDSTKMLQESQSTSTELNLKNSQAILLQHDLNIHSPIAIVTSDFHTLRATAIARKQGYDHFAMISAPTPLSTRYNAWLREYFAYISGWILNEY